jgi:hypothetical protein
MPTNRCTACGRRLRRPSPTGLGPVCERRLRPRTAARNTPAAAVGGPVPPMPGQTEIPLVHHQATLWSL